MRADRRREGAPSTREVVIARARRRRSSRRMGETLKVARLADIPEGDDDHALPPGRVRRPVPRPARAAHRPDRRLQADRASRAPTGAATSATRCSSASTAPPSRRRRSSTRTSTRLEEAQAPRPPPARRGARPLPPRPDRARLAVLPPEGRGRSTTPSSTTCAPLPTLRLPRGDHAAALPRRSSSRPRATTTPSTTTCS